MKLALITTVVLSAIATGAQSPTHKAPPQVQVANDWCGFDHDEVIGVNRMCYYRCNNGPRVITIRSSNVCPNVLQG